MEEGDSQPPPVWIKRAYDILSTDETRHGKKISRDHAYDLLLDHETFSDERDDAKFAVEQLLNRGWLYEVEGELRLTDPDPNPDPDTDPGSEGPSSSR